MEFNRNIINKLELWKNSSNRKPLLIRGARQVGKTKAVNIFSRQFESYVYLNLEQYQNARIFENVSKSEQIIRLIEVESRKKIIPQRTLLFIDEIQEQPNAIAQLRYFYEELPELHVIASGSLLEVVLENEGISMPVGRIDYLSMFPVTFDEFLTAKNNNIILDHLNQISLDSDISTTQHKQFQDIFLEYAFIGGMPEVVSNYIFNNNYIDIGKIYYSLMSGYFDDIGKYASKAEVKYLRHCLENAPRSVGMQIKYNHFAESGFRSREISLAFDMLEKAYLLNRVYSSRSISLPLVENKRKSPKLIFLDAGLVNYHVGIAKPFNSFAALENVYQGQLTEQLVGQALISLGYKDQQQLAYWYNDKLSSQAEVDYLINFRGQLVPIEVKAGATNLLKSLFSFMAKSGLSLGVRVYSGPLAIEKLQTATNHSYTLVSIPFYLIFRLDQLLAEFFERT